MEEPTTIIDRDVLKVLSADTRMDILKLLNEGARTPSYLGKHLNKTDPTIIEHLDIMVKTGLVKKIEQPGKKWIFYTLTDRGKGIISSKSRRLVIIISTSLLILAGGILSMSYFPQQLGTFARETQVSSAVSEGKGFVASTPVSNYLFYLGIILITISLIGIIFYFYKKSKARSQPISF
jgi:DNA-binding transcriptional ArsR family regulator